MPRTRGGTRTFAMLAPRKWVGEAKVLGIGWVSFRESGFQHRRERGRGTVMLERSMMLDGRVAIDGYVDCE